MRAMIRMAGMVLLAAATVATAQRIEQDFNGGWRFAAGAQAGAEAPGFNDAAWTEVRVPHDWAIAGPFDPALDGNTGMLPWRGEGWYRKRFALPADAAGRRVILIFDGVMASPKVHVNGAEAGGWTYGYNSFWLDVTAHAKPGAENVVAVHADTREHGSRWYPGAGIYRKVTLRIVDPVHVPVWGLWVTTPKVGDRAATVRVRTEIANAGAADAAVEVETTLLDPTGAVAATRRDPVSAKAGATALCDVSIEVADPKRWDVDAPCLYRAVVRVHRGGTAVDEAATTFGIRTFEWTANDGFHLNGRRLQLHGVNQHHDQGPLGAACLPRAAERQLEILRDMGVNALRTSHNPPAPEVLDLCDRMGIVVWDELYDKYGKTAGVPCSTAEYVEKHAEKEVRNFVRRDRNHPCVVIWSIGNEIPDILGDADGRAGEHVARMVAFFRANDDTRPTAIGCHMPGGAAKGKTILDALDATGWNYQAKYRVAKERYPDKPVIYSESASAFSTRGGYKLPLAKSKTDWGDDGVLNAYELTAASWADIPEHEFEYMKTDRYVAGEFVWTGFDYLGEPTPVGGKGWAHPARARSSYFGILDLAGMPKDRFFLYRSHWNGKAATVHLAPHWTWEGREGQPLPVMVYTSGDEAELFLNGRSLGRRAKRSAEAMKAANLAFGRTAKASSEEIKQDAGGNVQAENLAGKACDGNPGTRWCAADGTLPQTWQVDLGRAAPLGAMRIDWEADAAGYRFGVEVSRDGAAWSAADGDATAKSTGWRSQIDLRGVEARFVRVTITATPKKTWAGFRDVEIRAPGDAGADENPYYAVLDAYRLRWAAVPYEPGELKVVAYRGGAKIGEAVQRTAGAPAALRLAADRPAIRADGDDLGYVQIDAVDAKGTPCPHAAPVVTFRVEGPAALAGVDNGDPLGMDSFTDDRHPLFNGRAVAVLRSRAGAAGTVRLVASAPGMPEATVTLECR